MNKQDDNFVSYLALSIVAPHGENIAKGIKTLEVRLWKPEQLPLKNVLIVQNHRYLSQQDDQDVGQVMAMVDFVDVHEWREDEVIAACASHWESGYWAWTIQNVRPIYSTERVAAKRKIYTLRLNEPF